MKKTISVFLSLIILATSLIICNFSTFAATSGNYKYTVSGGKATITGFEQSYDVNGDPVIVNLSVPSKIGGYSVIAIGDKAFLCAYGLTKITIPSGVTSIGDEAFCNSDLKEISLPSSLKSLGKGAFRGCGKLTSINIPDNVTSIKTETFFMCRKLKTVKLPSKLKSIGERAFSSSSETIMALSKITIPSTVTSIGKYAFYKTNLESISIPKGVKSISEGTFSGCTKLTKVTIPSSITNIGRNAFYNCAFSSIKLPSLLESIGSYAFSNTKLKSVTIPNKVKTIPEYCFWNCSKLTNIKIGSGVKTIKSGAFSDTAITKLTIPKGVSSISSTFCRSSKIKTITVSSKNKNYSSYNGALYNKKKTTLIYYPVAKTNLKLAKGTKKIGAYAFADSKLNKVTLPSTVTSLGAHAFANSKLTKIVIPSTVTSLGVNAFEGSNIKQISLPGKIKTIPKYCFSHCTKLKNVKIPNSITKISEGAFWGTDISSIDLPNGLKSIGFRALDSDSLKCITIPSSVTSIEYLSDPEGTICDCIAGYKGTAAEKYAKKEGIKFIVAPAKGSLTSVSSPKKGAMNLKWKKVKGVAGYQIQISTSSTMSENTKTATIKGSSTVSKPITKLTKGKKYYVQVRAYKKVKVKGKTRTVYGSWSATKSIKIKK